MRRISRISVSLMLVLVLLVGATSTAFAAPAKKTTKKCSFTTKTAAIEKKATKVKKGTTNLTVKKGQGYVKFVAPATKTYKITFSNSTCSQFNNNGFVEIQTPDSRSPKYSFMTKVKTKGGKSNVMWLSVNGYKFTSKTHKKAVSRPLAKRTGSIKLKKGQVLYLYMFFGSSTTKTKLVIK